MVFGRKRIFFCSYFIHLDRDLCAQGQFHSRQWEGLPKSLRESGKSLNWIQLFLFSAVVPDLSTGLVGCANSITMHSIKDGMRFSKLM